MSASSCSNLSLSDTSVALQNHMPVRSRATRRKCLREPASFLVHCQQADLNRVGGEALNWSSGGIAIKTNCPIRVGEHLTVEFVEPRSLDVHRIIGQVVWWQFHGDSSLRAETLFTAGIKFLNLIDCFELTYIPTENHDGKSSR